MATDRGLDGSFQRETATPKVAEEAVHVEGLKMGWQKAVEQF